MYLTELDWLHPSRFLGFRLEIKLKSFQWNGGFSYAHQLSQV